MNRFSQALPMLVVLLLAAVPAATAQETVDLVGVEKAKRRLEPMSGHVVRTDTIALGFAADGDKRQEGDGRTSEGKYVIERRNASSKFHLSLKISYPDAVDHADAAARGNGCRNRRDLDPGAGRHADRGQTVALFTRRRISAGAA